MAESQQLLAALDRSFRSACRAILGQEIGGLKENRGLFRYAAPMKKAKSALSGEEVYFFAPYNQASRFISLDEKQLAAKAKFSPNDIKDIDSLLRAARETAYYCGSKAIGTSKYVERSDNVSDSFFILSSHEIIKSEYLAYCELSINCRHLFGCSSNGETSHCVGVTESFRTNRSYESCATINSSDILYSHSCFGCRDCIFCFSQRGASNSIGNNALAREKYLSMKCEILSQVAERIRARKPITLSAIFGE